MIKKTLVFLIIVTAAILFWFGFALWTGIYSVYTYPASKEYPDGATLIVAREEGEPLFNSPQYTPPPKKPEPKSGGLVFTGPTKTKRPIDARTIVELPYVDWAYRKSLEPQDTE